MKIRVMIGLIVALVIATAAVGQDRTPSQVYGQLFEDVQMQHVFPDGKTFVDAVPRDAPAIVMQRYQVERGTSGRPPSTMTSPGSNPPRPSRPGLWAWALVRAGDGTLGTLAPLPWLPPLLPLLLPLLP
jgi:hypothetical protein